MKSDFLSSCLPSDEHFQCVQPCPYPGVSWMLPPAVLLCLSRRQTESQNSDLFCYELVAPNCTKCITGGNLYVQRLEIPCHGYHGDCMHSEKLMNGL